MHLYIIPFGGTVYWMKISHLGPRAIYPGMNGELSFRDWFRFNFGFSFSQEQHRFIPPGNDCKALFMVLLCSCANTDYDFIYIACRSMFKLIPKHLNMHTWDKWIGAYLQLLGYKRDRDLYTSWSIYIRRIRGYYWSISNLKPFKLFLQLTWMSEAPRWPYGLVPTFNFASCKWLTSFINKFSLPLDTKCSWVL
jgi:hypothetical protein